MTKNQKMLLGIGAIAVVGYLLWKKQQTSFTGAYNRFATVGSRQKNASGTGKITPSCWNKIPAPYCTSKCGQRFLNSKWGCACSGLDLTDTPTSYDCDTWLPIPRF